MHPVRRECYPREIPQPGGRKTGCPLGLAIPFAVAVIAIASIAARSDLPSQCGKVTRISSSQVKESASQDNDALVGALEDCLTVHGHRFAYKAVALDGAIEERLCLAVDLLAQGLCRMSKRSGSCPLRALLSSRYSK